MTKWSACNLKPPLYNPNIYLNQNSVKWTHAHTGRQDFHVKSTLLMLTVGSRRREKKPFNMERNLHRKLVFENPAEN